MKIFSGKKALCFIALPHHNRFLVPIMNALEREGMQTGYFTAAAEGAFEITLNQAGLPYRHLYDYAHEETREKANAAFGSLRPQLQEKILASQTLQAVPVAIQDKSVRGAVDNFYAMQRMLEVEKPDLLFALHEINPWGKILGYLSHEFRIPYFTLQEGLYYSHIFYHRFHTDYSTACIVWGEACRRTLLQAGCSPDKIFPLGNTQIWTAKERWLRDDEVRQTRRSLGIADGKKVVLFLLSHSRYDPFDARQLVDWMNRRGDVVAVLKWHPITGKDIIERALERHRREPLFINAPEHNTYALIAASDVCVAIGNSTTGLEALAFGKPLIEVRLPDQAYSFALQGVAEQAVEFEDIAVKANDILTRGVAPTIGARAKEYLAENFAYQDGHTLERIVALVGEALTARASQEADVTPLRVPNETAYPCSIVLPVDDAPPSALLATLQSVATHTPAELFEVVIVNCATDADIQAMLKSLSGDLTVIEGKPSWSFAQACNCAAATARGKYLAFLKPGYLLAPGWLESLIAAAEADVQVGVVGGERLNEHGLIWHIGAAFDVNQSPFSIYRMLPREFSGARKGRRFRAMEAPFLVPRGLFGRLGGFAAELHNRFEDIDFCLRANRAGLLVQYTPDCTMIRHPGGWAAPEDKDYYNRIRFYAKWTGHLWQDDRLYLLEDNLTHDALSALYRDLAGRVSAGARLAAASMSGATS